MSGFGGAIRHSRWFLPFLFHTYICPLISSTFHFRKVFLFFSFSGRGFVISTNSIDFLVTYRSITSYTLFPPPPIGHTLHRVIAIHSLDARILDSPCWFFFFSLTHLPNPPPPSPLFPPASIRWQCLYLSGEEGAEGGRGGYGWLDGGRRRKRVLILGRFIFRGGGGGGWLADWNSGRNM